MDEALLNGIMSVDDYVTRLVKQMDEEQSKEELQRKLEERDKFLKKLENYLKEENRMQTLRQCFFQWQQFCLAKKYQRALQQIKSLENEVENISVENTTLNRQKRELQSRISELNGRRTHGIDVSDLAAQVKELVQRLEKEKSEKAMLIAKYEGKGGKQKMPLVSSSEFNAKQGDGMARVVREYQQKLQRMEEEISNEKLKRANESAKRLEKESECVKLRREVEDAKAEVVSLQLKLARIEVASNPLGETTIEVTSLPRKESKSLSEEAFDNHLPEYHEVTANNKLTSNAPRKSFFRPAGSASINPNASRKPILPPLEENGREDTCTQQ